MVKRIGIVGIGNMGMAMAQRLCAAGWAVAVRDLDTQRERDAAALGALVCASPAALAACSDVLLVVVVDAVQVDDVLFGIDGAAAALAPGSTVLLCPTVAPADVERAAARLAALRLGCLDAPMSGGPARARNGSMSLMVAGDDAVFARCSDLIDALSSQVFRVSQRPGDGARTKLVNNLAAAINLAGMAEVLGLAAAAGLDPAQTLAVIEASSGQSWIGSHRGQRLFAGDQTPSAQLALLAKDSKLAMSMADETQTELPLGRAAQAIYAQALLAGLGPEEDSVLLRRALAAADGAARRTGKNT